MAALLQRIVAQARSEAKRRTDRGADMMQERQRAALSFAAVLLLLALLALARPIDHDESQYVAATILAWRGLPYRDFAYLQTPLQPMLLAPIAALAGGLAWPVLRLANALFGALALAGCYGAAREAGAGRRAAVLATGLFGCCDIFLFTSAVARNDALPAACLSFAIWIALRAQHGRGTMPGALLAGLLLAAAAAAKISFALPAIAYGAWALWDRRHFPVALAMGAIPVAAMVAWLYAIAPGAFMFGVFTFPADAPAEWYRDHNPWKLTAAAKAIDTLKFLALGPALPALIIVAINRRRGHTAWLLTLLIAAGLVAGLLPEPTWRQYLLPVLPPLFVRLAMAWEAAPPARWVRIAIAIFIGAGFAPTAEGLIKGGGATMIDATEQGHAIGAVARANGIEGPIATLSPQFLPAADLPIDPRFAAGPYYFRSHGLLAPALERRFGVISRARIDFAGTPPAAILVGGEGPWTSGDAGDDAALEAYAIGHRWRRIDIPGGHFRLYAKLQAAARRAPATSPS